MQCFVFLRSDMDPSTYTTTATTPASPTDESLALQSVQELQDGGQAQLNAMIDSLRHEEGGRQMLHITRLTRVRPERKRACRGD